MAGAQLLAALVLLCACVTMTGGSKSCMGDGKSSDGGELRSKSFRSPSLTVDPGDVVSGFYRVDMPSGHVALRGLEAQLVDSDGEPVPLTKAYIHHWAMLRYHIVKGSSGETLDSRPRIVPNDGVCQAGSLEQWFGMGSESRRTNSTLPAPYGIVVGDPEKIPYGFEEAWFLEVHVIDVRGTVEPRACAECVCRFYNVSYDAFGGKISEDYKGGLKCCYDGTHCDVKKGYEGAQKKLFLEYTVHWVPMDDDVRPVRVYVLDVTDNRDSIHEMPHCKVEYDVEQCAKGEKKCVHTAEANVYLLHGGDLIYAVAHQNIGGTGATLYNEKGTELCTSSPYYGEGTEPGDESGHVVGMTTCYPKPGSVTIQRKEKLRFKAWYNNEERHTGVMSLFYLVVADTDVEPKKHKKVKIALTTLGIIAALTLVGVTLIRYWRTRDGRPGYEAI